MHTEWILKRIKTLEELHKKYKLPGGTGRQPTHRNIWQGSYDVWHNEQDRIDAVEIPKASMKAAEEAGLIVSEEKTFKGMLHGLEKVHYYTVWSVTELGEEFLKENA